MGFLLSLLAFVVASIILVVKGKRRDELNRKWTKLSPAEQYELKELHNYEGLVYTVCSLALVFGLVGILTFGYQLLTERNTTP